MGHSCVKTPGATKRRMDVLSGEDKCPEQEQVTRKHVGCINVRDFALFYSTTSSLTTLRNE